MYFDIHSVEIWTERFCYWIAGVNGFTTFNIWKDELISEIYDHYLVVL